MIKHKIQTSTCPSISSSESPSLKMSCSTCLCMLVYLPARTLCQLAGTDTLANQQFQDSILCWWRPHPMNGDRACHHHLSIHTSASSRIRFLPVQAQPTAARSSRRAVVAPRGRHIGRYFLLNNIAITNNSTFPKIKLHYSISYCNKPNLII